jgi:hypothetical protein
MRVLGGTLICLAAFLFLAQNAIAQQEEPAEDSAGVVREAYHRLVNEEAMDFDESRKLVEDCRKHIALLAENDPEGLVVLAREILLDNPELLESEKQRGLKPPRLEVKGSLMGALVVVGSKSAHELLEELAQKVESGEAQRVALGASPADLLEVPVKYDKMIMEALEGKSSDPKADLENAIRFAQVHFVSKILLAEYISGLSRDEFIEIDKKARDRIYNEIKTGEFKNPLAALKLRKVESILLEAMNKDSAAQLPEDLYKRLVRLDSIKAEKRQTKKIDVSGKPSRDKPEKGETSPAQGKLNLEKMELQKGRQNTSAEKKTIPEQLEAENNDGISAIPVTVFIVIASIAVLIAAFLLIRRRS